MPQIPGRIQCFFNNACGVTFKLYDVDNNFVGEIGPGYMSSLMLNYSSTFQKQYNLIQFGTNNTISFWLDINGELLRVGPGVAILQIGSLTRLGFANLLNIYPGPTLPLAQPQYIPFNSPALTNYNDY